MRAGLLSTLAPPCCSMFFFTLSDDASNTSYFPSKPSPLLRVGAEALFIPSLKRFSIFSPGRTYKRFVPFLLLVFFLTRLSATLKKWSSFPPLIRISILLFVVVRRSAPPRAACLPPALLFWSFSPFPKTMLQWQRPFYTLQTQYPLVF